MDVVRSCTPRTRCSDFTVSAPRPPPPLPLPLLSHLNGSKDAYGETALIYASMHGFTDVVRELIAADGSVEHLRMQTNNGMTALDCAGAGADQLLEEIAHVEEHAEVVRIASSYDEIKALLTAAEAAADTGRAAPPPEGKAREGEEEDEEEDSPPPQTQGGAQPKKTLPRPVYEGKADALVEILIEARSEGEEPDITKVHELLDAGIDIRYQVRLSCVCALVLV